jgi:hypothetical protein
VSLTLLTNRRPLWGAVAFLRCAAVLCLLLCGFAAADAQQLMNSSARPDAFAAADSRQASSRSSVPTNAQSPAAPPAAIELGTIAGTVVDIRGALVDGALVKLSRAKGSRGDLPAQQTTTGGDGRFAFAHVAPGDFVISVTLPGFGNATAAGSLQSGQSLVMPLFALKLATAKFEVEVYSDPQELAEQQIHLEEQQRLIGIFPNFFVSYDWKAQPLSEKQKFSLAWKNARDPGNLLLVGATAGVQQADNAFSGYGQGAVGYGSRYGADLGNLVAGTFIGGAVLPSLFHQDPRYFYKGTGSARARILYALSSAVICRGDSGRRQPAFAGVLGDLSAGAISNLYYPASDRQGATLTLENGFLGVAGDALNGLFQEFFLRKLTPGASGRAPKQP